MFSSARIQASSSSSQPSLPPVTQAPAPGVPGLTSSFAALSLESSAPAAVTPLADMHPRLQIVIPAPASESESAPSRSSSESPSTPPRAETGPRQAPWAPPRKRKLEEEEPAPLTPPQSPTGSEIAEFDTEDDGPPSPLAPRRLFGEQ